MVPSLFHLILYGVVRPSPPRLYAPLYPSRVPTSYAVDKSNCWILSSPNPIKYNFVPSPLNSNPLTLASALPILKILFNLLSIYSYPGVNRFARSSFALVVIVHGVPIVNWFIVSRVVPPK